MSPTTTPTRSNPKAYSTGSPFRRGRGDFGLVLLSSAGLALGSRPDAEEVDRGGPHHRLAVLVLRLDERLEDAAVRFALRSARLQDRDANTESIPRADGMGPAQLVHAQGAQARFRGHVVVYDLPHDQGRGVPAAGDQPAERPVGRGHRVDVKRLRIELSGERDDLSLVNADASAVGRRPGQVVLEIPQASHGRSIPGQAGP